MWNDNPNLLTQGTLFNLLTCPITVLGLVCPRHENLSACAPSAVPSHQMSETIEGAIDAPRVPTGTGLTDTPTTVQWEAHSRPVTDDIAEISLLPTPGPSSGSPQTPPQSHRSMHRTPSNRSSSRAESVAGASQGAPRTTRDQPGTHQLVDAPSPPPSEQAQRRPSVYARMRTFLGHGNPSRRRIVHTVFSLALYLSQIVLCAVFIGLTRTIWRSRSAQTRGGTRHLSEWDACDKPLGSMMIVWMVRCIFGVLLTFWSFKRSIMMCVSLHHQ
jgi:hypothetical protein